MASEEDYEKRRKEAAIIVATSRLLLNGKPCTLEAIAEKARVTVKDVDSLWRRSVIHMVDEYGDKHGDVLPVRPVYPGAAAE